MEEKKRAPPCGYDLMQALVERRLPLDIAEMVMKFANPHATTYNRVVEAFSKAMKETPSYTKNEGHWLSNVGKEAVMRVFDREASRDVSRLLRFTKLGRPGIPGEWRLCPGSPEYVQFANESDPEEIQTAIEWDAMIREHHLGAFK
jgi:hypothetical protein